MLDQAGNNDIGRRVECLRLAELAEDSILVEATAKLLQGVYRWAFLRRRPRNRNCRWITTPDGKARKEIDPPILSPEVAPADLKEAARCNLELFRCNAVVATDDIGTAFETAAETELGRW